MRLSLFLLGLYPMVTVVFFIAGYLDREGLYDRLLDEDGVVEWVTALTIMLTGLFALGVAWRLRRRGLGKPWAILAVLIVAGGCFLAGLEEISYGQRLFGWESNEFFVENSDQQETNIHNVVQAYLKDHGWPIYKTRHFLALGMGVYGLVLPMALWGIGRRPKRGTLGDLVVPPFYLAAGFALGCFFTIFDWPTGYEEEIGEAYLASCVLFMVGRAWIGLPPRDLVDVTDSDQAAISS